MNYSIFLFRWLLVIFTFFSISVTCTSFNIPRLGLMRRIHILDPEIVAAPLSEDFQTFFYNQTLDHFNYRPESYSTFQQRYVMNFKFWGGAACNAPILAFFGGESPLDADLANVGFLPDNANRFRALLVYIEHRYYGKSIPFGSIEEAMNSANNSGYFNSAQALADCAEILMYIKKQYQAEDSPVIVVGGSYGGELAAWFRLKYPHIALGALASSAPVLYYDDITPTNAYYTIVAKDFREASETCYQTIIDSWSEIDKVGSENNGTSILSLKFKTCSPLENSFDLKAYLIGMYAGAAQYNRPPNYPVNIICGAIDGVPTGTDILGKIFAGVVANNGNRSCYINQPTHKLVAKTDGWQWQRCSEMVVPIDTKNVSMFFPYSFDLNAFIDNCERIYGVSPRPHWVTTYYGGYDIKLFLRRFGSNIIFSNGLKDPYSGGGVLEDISDTVVAVSTVNGSHCLDIVGPSSTTDPDWLVKQRQTEVEIVEGWIAKYNADLQAFKK